jgi:hypothetical protein
VVLLPEVHEVEVLDTGHLGTVPTVGQQPAIHRLKQKEQYITLRLRHEIFIAYLATMNLKSIY